MPTILLSSIWMYRCAVQICLLQVQTRFNRLPLSITKAILNLGLLGVKHRILRRCDNYPVLHHKRRGIVQARVTDTHQRGLVPAVHRGKKGGKGKKMIYYRRKQASSLYFRSLLYNTGRLVSLSWRTSSMRYLSFISKTGRVQRVYRDICHCYTATVPLLLRGYPPSDCEPRGHQPCASFLELSSPHCLLALCALLFRPVAAVAWLILNCPCV